MLSIKTIKNYSDTNNWEYSDEWIVRQGDTKNLYFQLVNVDRDGLRYMLDSGDSIEVSFPQLADDPIVKSAIQADPLDSSIWYISIGATDELSSGSVFFEVIEGGIASSFGVSDILKVQNSNASNPNWGGC